MRTGDGRERLAAEYGGGLRDITTVFPSMLDLIRGGHQALERVREALPQAPALPVGDYKILAPIPHPQRDVYCVGWNYLKHFNEGVGKRGSQETDLPEFPTFFNKATRAVIATNDPVPYDRLFTEKLDYEAEIAVIISQEGKNIAEDQAMDYVFGYTLANDVSARDVQRRHGGQWLKGKSMDGSCPLGPAIVTRDEVAAVESLNIRGIVNGEVRQEARLSQLIFSIPRLIAELSRGMTLLPGDILLTGTPDGVGFAMDPPVYLHPGDRVVVESDALGRLENVIGPDFHETR
ncbi:fumarylacetoacetate hydrolase family protein [Sulfobacillus sp. DSM 109850]|uniref:Fumarylacetoacetate hydrolase family protein n=2 Tax=Sulfobacillus harzensis TaxID=2729629 RepID=A0A7Y0L6D9_9FIRM|nr:fumarylacetoacetate hydrolase family protein [Sulfobacillus harzensis]